MDTRSKIIDRAAAESSWAGQPPFTVVTGFFDPLTAAHAARLEEVAGQGGLLLVVVRTPGRPLLPARARAELVAGLAAVDGVVIEEGDPAWISRLPASAVIHEEEADLARTRALLRRVHDRQAAG
ncbi:MAG: hypothetical protein HY822_14245 [Acidobacteria bacterium]|nr:hypothetical protein [Acidobacteriota bacterium]